MTFAAEMEYSDNPTPENFQGHHSEDLWGIAILQNWRGKF